MARFQCVFPSENPTQPASAHGKENGGESRPPIEAVYEFKAPDIEQLYRWLLKQGAPIRSIRDIEPVESDADLS